MSNQKPAASLDLADLSAALPAAAAGLSAEDRAGLVSALKDKLQSLAGKHSDMMESLPVPVRKRVEALKEIQSQHDEFEAKFFEERAVLEAKYQKLYEPLYTKRYEIVNGIVEVENVTTETPADNESSEVKGVPDFWLTAMKTNEIITEEITERDEAVLKFLKDIKWSRIDDPKGFKLDFFFDTNPFFKNAVLTKTYHMIDEDDPVLEKAIGTEIEWYPGKCLTQKVLVKKPRKGSKNTKPITKTEKCESFFNFFNPPQVPDDDEIDEEVAEELQSQMEQDYDVGSSIRDKIIPHAVSWFTGEAAGDDMEDLDMEDLEDDDDDDDDDDEDDEDEEEDEDDEDDDDDEDDVGSKAKKQTTRKKKLGADGQQADRPAECKQQ